MIPLSRRVLTPRTPGGWALFIGRIAAAVLLVLVTLPFVPLLKNTVKT